MADWTAHCLDSRLPCDCPTPPEPACVEGVPASGRLTPAPRWVDNVIEAHPWAGAWLWSPSPSPTTRYLVTLHGSDETAAKEFYWWQPRVEALTACTGSDIGVLAIQYGRATSSGTEYLLWGDINLLIDGILEGAVAAGYAARGGHAFHGFSRGSADLYGVAVLDGRDGSRWGTRFITNSGAWRPGASPPDPVAEELAAGSATALAGTEFLVFYGLQDHDQGQHGYIGQSGAARAVRQLGGRVEIWVDVDGCHSAFEASDRPRHAWDALVWAFP